MTTIPSDTQLSASAMLSADDCLIKDVGRSRCPVPCSVLP